MNLSPKIIGKCYNCNMKSIQSSKTQTFLYYIVNPIIIVASAWVIYRILEYKYFGIFNLIIILVLAYGLVLAIESFLTLRLVEANEDSVNFGIFTTNNKINYRDIYYAYSLVSFKASYGIIWYKDTNSNFKVILLRPKELMPNKLVGLEIINFIKEKAKKENPNYLNIYNERWFLFSISPTFRIF